MAKPHRVLTERQQIQALADGDKWVAQALDDIRTYASAIIGRSRRLASKVHSLGGESEVQVQTSSVSSQAEDAVDWLESARRTLRDLARGEG